MTGKEVYNQKIAARIRRLSHCLVVIPVIPCKSWNISVLRFHAMSVGKIILGPEKVLGLLASCAEEGRFA